MNKCIHLRGKKTERRVVVVMVMVRGEGEGTVFNLLKEYA